ncbi:MAG TPA: hypothetical protein VEB42_13325 [Chitinophagaceae bacterium]|nr:hypothetical protein [Chitinophagaceae bacterium]
MADCNFSIGFPGTAADIISKVQGQIQQQGGTFNGDPSSGSFSVKVMGSTIAGSYTISGSNLNIAINDKPFFVGCGAIESFLKNHIGG